MHLFHVPDLKCGGCLGFVVRALRDIDQTVRITADIPARTLRVISTRFESALLRALREAGYTAEPILLPLG
ncbi:heavy-metal-associated domain-containing protein [Microvirga sp. VF16]|uniref:heavy-metal-associated domain-containing protein n=1 Tax=Microvirga sp. VF16 TaxID=2807101 RepID=UPI00193E1C0F|nr:heavy-metal-associated domain-containing protein [Microvirga sp. VF16]QRM31336.1 heavy-metal-associated domain-containing protein [Microvirga sp. VF16]